MSTPLQMLLDTLQTMSPKERHVVRAVLDDLPDPDPTERQLLERLADHGCLFRSSRRLEELRRPVARFLAGDAAASGDAALLVSEAALHRAPPGLTDRLEAVTLSPVVGKLAAGLAERHGLGRALAVDLASCLLVRGCYQSAGLAGPRFVTISEQAAGAATRSGLVVEALA